MTVIDEFLEEAKKQAAAVPPKAPSTPAQRYAELKGRRDKELELFHAWHESGRKTEDLGPLLTSIRPMIQSEAKKRMAGLGGSIPRSALEAALTTAATKAIHSYDPARLGQTGAPVKLTTHIHNNFQRVTDFVGANRNARYLTRGKLDRAGELTAAQKDFEQREGRPPTFTELHTELPKWNKKELRTLVNAMAPEVHTGLSEFTEDATASVDQYRAAVHLVYGKLSPLEQQFANLHYPEAGETPLSVKQIAKKMGVPEHKVYRIRSRVDKHLEPLVKGA